MHKLLARGSGHGWAKWNTGKTPGKVLMIGGPGTQSTEKSQYFSEFPLGNFTSNLLVKNKLLQGMQEKYKHSLYFSFHPILTIALLLATSFR